LEEEYVGLEALDAVKKSAWKAWSIREEDVDASCV
jgi:hypothetical protein